MDQGAESVILRASFLHDCLDLGFVRCRQGSAGGVGQQLLGQSAGELILVLQQQLLELYWFGVNWKFAFGALARLRDRTTP